MRTRTMKRVGVAALVTGALCCGAQLAASLLQLTALLGVTRWLDSLALPIAALGFVLLGLSAYRNRGDSL